MWEASRTWSAKSRGNARLNRSKSLASEARKLELVIRRGVRQHQARHQLADGGAVLEAVSRSPADDPGIGGRGMAVGDEMLIGGTLVLAHARFDERRVLQAREPVAEVLARDLERVGAGRALAAGGIERWAARVVGHLEAAPLVAGNAVHEALAVIGPDRQRVLAVAMIAGRRAEKEDFLARGMDALADDVGKQRAQPRPAGEDEPIGGERAAVRQCHGAEGAAARLDGPLPRELPVRAACGEKSVEHGGARAPRGQIAGILFEDRPADLIGVDLWVAARDLIPLQQLEGDARVAQNRPRRVLELLVALHEPEHADAVKQRQVPAALILLPQCQRPHRHAGVDGARAVGRANHARLSARARPRVAGSPGVDERDARALTPQEQRRPSSKGPGTHDGDVLGWLLRFRHQSSEYGSGARLHEPSPRQRRRASRTARRTASRSVREA